jgi:hypothetical protein
MGVRAFSRDESERYPRIFLGEHVALIIQVRYPSVTIERGADSSSNLYILLYRSAYLGAQEDNEQDIVNIALQAACRNTRIIEDVLSQDLVQHSNVSMCVAPPLTKFSI